MTSPALASGTARWFAVLLLAGTAFTSSPCRAAGKQDASPWIPGFEKATQKAFYSGKDILLIFTVRRMSAACRQFEKYYLTRPEFAAALKPHFELVWLDVSENGGDKEGSPAFRLRKRFEVTSFPAVILTNKTGQPYAYTGLRPGSLENYLQHLQSLRQKNEKRRLVYRQAQSARGIDRARLLAQAIPELGEHRSAKFYGDIMREILSLDPENKSGHAAETRRRLADLEYTTQFRDLDKELRWSDMVELTNRYMEEQRLTGASRQAALMNRLDVHRRQDDIPSVLQTLQEIIQINPYNRHGQQASMILTKITSDIREQATLANPEIDE